MQVLGQVVSTAVKKFTVLWLTHKPANQRKSSELCTAHSIICTYNKRIISNNADVMS